MDASFPGIAAAIAELGHPRRVWFRGHVATHQLLPSLFRFPGGAELEQRIFARLNREGHGCGQGRVGGLDALLATQQRYVPTRLLAWTERLPVALFCALVRESDQPAVFVLDPIALNAVSGISGVFKSSSRTLGGVNLSAWPLGRSWPKAPIAVDGGSPGSQDGGTLEAVYTVHGVRGDPLEKQCPHCVRRVVLTDEERARSMRAILDGM